MPCGLVWETLDQSIALYSWRKRVASRHAGRKTLSALMAIFISCESFSFSPSIKTTPKKLKISMSMGLFHIFKLSKNTTKHTGSQGGYRVQGRYMLEGAPVRHRVHADPHNHTLGVYWGTSTIHWATVPPTLQHGGWGFIMLYAYNSETDGYKEDISQM